MSDATHPMKLLVEAVKRMSGNIRDPKLAQIARGDIDRMRDETRKRIGTVEVAVDLIRAARHK
jgi:hypothetical protein